MKGKLHFRLFLSLCLICIVSRIAAQDSSNYYTIRVIDEQTGRGIPLVELSTMNSLKYYTDSKGIIAFNEPTLMNLPVFFSVFSHGYKPLFDDEGIQLTTARGKGTIIKLKRINIAERLYRITGQDIYGQTALLGLPVPIQHQALNGKVLGQDTYIETLYKGKLYWFWGDTEGPGRVNFKASGATSELPTNGGLDPETGINLNYFVDSSGFCKEMCPFPGRVLEWIDWIAALKDEKGNERLYAQYTTINADHNPGINGMAVFNDSSESFQQLKVFDEWYGKGHVSTHLSKVKIRKQDYLYNINSSGIQRVPADVKSILDPGKYEQFTCLAPQKKGDTVSSIVWDKSHQPVYAWKSNAESINPMKQTELVQSGNIIANQGLWQFQDIISGQSIPIGPQSVCWNEYRKRWVLIAYEFPNGVWFSEGDTPTGPWVYARKIVTHEHYDFYNVGQHPLFDKEGGRLIYFEGTYTTGLSGNTNPTPLYDYNQLMYRLSLDDKRLSLPAPVYLVKNKKDKETYYMRESVDSLHLWAEIQKIPFFAIPVKEGYSNLIPVYSLQTDLGTKLILEPSKSHPAKLLFYALPMAARNVKPKNVNSIDNEDERKQNSSLVFLYEYKNNKSNKIFYSVDPNLVSETIIRKTEPLCKVWMNPLSVLALDYMAMPVK